VAAGEGYLWIRSLDASLSMQYNYRPKHKLYVSEDP